MKEVSVGLTGSMRPLGATGVSGWLRTTFMDRQSLPYPIVMRLRWESDMTFVREPIPPAPFAAPFSFRAAPLSGKPASHLVLWSLSLVFGGSSDSWSYRWEGWAPWLGFLGLPSPKAAVCQQFLLQKTRKTSDSVNYPRSGQTSCVPLP